MMALPGTSRSSVAGSPRAIPRAPSSCTTFCMTSSVPLYLPVSAWSLHLMSSVGLAIRDATTPAPAPLAKSCGTVSGAPEGERSFSIRCRVSKSAALKTTTVASGGSTPRYRPPTRPSWAIVLRTASIGPVNIGGSPGLGTGMDCSLTLIVSNGCPTASWHAPPNPPAARSTTLMPWGGLGTTFGSAGIFEGASSIAAILGGASRGAPPLSPGA